MNSYTIGVVGAGGMGTGITRRLTAAGHTVLVTDSKPGTAATAAADVGILVLALWHPGTP